MKKKKKLNKPEVYKVRRWALRRANGSFACIKRGATIPFTARDVAFYFSDDDRALSYNWLILTSREQAKWYQKILDVDKEGLAGLKLHPVRVDVEIKITPSNDIYWRNWK